jgi:uncharacterized membrane protein YgdD (TMEM256/DUF423 family)
LPGYYDKEALFVGIKKSFAILGLLGVFLGAFGAHYLKNKITPLQQQTWNTASFYLFVHVLAGLYSTSLVSKKRSQYLFLGGILLFSGSLYALSLSNISAFGIVTPIGGVLFILGWLFLALDTVE